MIKDILKEPLTWCLGVFFLFIIVIPGFGIHYANKAQDSFELDCKNKGGEVIVLRRDSLCVSSDGRILAPQGRVGDL